jgi:hypothetical protein
MENHAAMDAQIAAGGFEGVSLTDGGEELVFDPWKWKRKAS